MFDKLRQLKQLGDLQRQLRTERVEVAKEGVRVVLNGTMQTEAVTLNAELSTEDQERILQECWNDAAKKVQLMLAQKMSQLQQ